MAIAHVCDRCGQPALEADRIEAAQKTVVLEASGARPAIDVTVALVVVAPQALCGTCQVQAWRRYLEARYAAAGVPVE